MPTKSGFKSYSEMDEKEFLSEWKSEIESGFLTEEYLKLRYQWYTSKGQEDSQKYLLASQEAYTKTQAYQYHWKGRNERVVA